MIINNTEYTCRELTVREVQQVMAPKESATAGNTHVLDMLFHDEIPSKAVSISSGLPVSGEGTCLESLSTSEYEQLLSEVRGANPRFSAMIARFVATVERVMRES